MLGSWPREAGAVGLCAQCFSEYQFFQSARVAGFSPRNPQSDLVHNLPLDRDMTNAAGNFSAAGPVLEGTGGVINFYAPDDDPAMSYQFEILD